MESKSPIRPVDLANLSAAVSRIQLTIERFAEADGTSVFRGATPSAAMSGPARSGAVKFEPRLAKALELKRQKDVRAELLGRQLNLIGDPIWNLLLELFIAHSRREPISISAASNMMAVPMTTALRYISYCEGRGMVERQDDPFDRRRCFLVLTADGDATLCDYIDGI